MDHVLCLVGENLTETGVEDALRPCFAAYKIDLKGAHWLSPGYALDLNIAIPKETALSNLMGSLRKHIARVDMAVLPIHNRRKSLLVADMDSTLITTESIVEIARIARVEAQVESLTRQAMQGRIDFAEALLTRVRLVAGTPVESVEALGHEITLTDGAEVLCATMAAHSARLVMVSGGFTAMAAVVASRLGLDRFVANEFVITSGTLSGGLKLPLVDADTKVEVMHAEAASLGLSPLQVLAVGDGANDVPMLQRAGLGVAYYGKPIVQAAATAAINHTDLRSLLYFQGYREQDLIYP